MKLEWTEEVDGYFEANEYFKATGYGNRTYVIYDDGTQWVAEIDSMLFDYDRTVDELKADCQEMDDLKENG